MTINVLFAAHPSPPVQPVVGNAPIGFLTDTAFPAANFIPTQFTGYALGNSLSRADVRAICTNPAIDPLAAYAVAMAWGGQNRANFRTSVVAAGLPGLLTTLRTIPGSRAHHFDVAAKAAAGIAGLGIAFYTKLLYFFRPNPDAYILDQWTAKSAAMLFTPKAIRLENVPANGYYPPANDTTPVEYEAFCKAIEALAIRLWPGTGGMGENAEAAMFDEGYGRGFWRNFVDGHFSHSDAGARLYKGWTCCTAAQDLDDGWLVLGNGTEVVVFVTSIKGGNRGLLVMLARIREIGATEIIFPTGNGGILLPIWFTDACVFLGVKIRGAGGGSGCGGGATISRPPTEPAGGLTGEVAPPAPVVETPINQENQAIGPVFMPKDMKIYIENANSFLRILCPAIHSKNVGYICHKKPNGIHFGEIAIYTDLWDLLVAAGCQCRLPLNATAPHGNPPSQNGKIRIHRPAGNSPLHAIEWLEQYFVVINTSGF